MRKHPKTPSGRRKTPTSLLRNWSYVKIWRKYGLEICHGQLSHWFDYWKDLEKDLSSKYNQKVFCKLQVLQVCKKFPPSLRNGVNVLIYDFKPCL
jgi:hypothetical protein